MNAPCRPQPLNSNAAGSRRRSTRQDLAVDVSFFRRRNGLDELSRPMSARL